MLERGPWRDTVATRYAGIEGAKPLPRDGGMFTVLRSLRPPKGPNRITLNRNGYLEKWIGDGIKVPVTSNVGGGSHIWAAILERPEGDYWDGRADGVSSEALAPHYDRMTQELRGTQPEDASNVPNHTDEAWKGAGFLTDLKPGEQPPMGILYGDGNSDVVTDENGITRKPIDMATDNGMFGSPDASKSTVDALFLLPAVQDGLDVAPCTKCRISPGPMTAFSVAARDLGSKRNVTLNAPKVILAAGTMNTNALLLNSVDAGALPNLPALGHGLGANGDLIGKWPSDGRDARLGPPSSGRIKIAGHEDSAYVILAAGEAPPVPGFMRKKAHKDASGMFQIVAMSQDASDGRIWMDKGRVKFAYDLKNSHSFAATMRAYDSLGQASGRKVTYPDKAVFSAHPCGGCRVSDDPQQGVVDGHGRVHGCPGLYVTDASIFPRSLGVPPSLTIATWSLHVAEHILTDN